ncbi:hypothetical protein [Comamonas sp. 26]|uniref:hypothetical protein n=1 Tax=Comamonas sp. 26 TaxID=2035201 RepID=UPI0013047852|nr:hypothetical protein [Comamonas sp. 26]
MGEFHCNKKHIVTFADSLGSLHNGLGMALDDRTRRMLEQWEVKHGLSVIEKRLDTGLFVYNIEKQKDCYLWLRARRATSWTHIVGVLVLGRAGAVMAAALISTLS